MDETIIKYCMMCHNVYDKDRDAWMSKDTYETINDKIPPMSMSHGVCSEACGLELIIYSKYE